MNARGRERGRGRNEEEGRGKWKGGKEEEESRGRIEVIDFSNRKKCLYNQSRNSSVSANILMFGLISYFAVYLSVVIHILFLCRFDCKVFHRSVIPLVLMGRLSAHAIRHATGARDIMPLGIPCFLVFSMS